MRGKTVSDDQLLKRSGMAKRPREKIAETLGANVRYLREHASMSQVELARRMAERGWSWHQATIYKVETGKQFVRLDEALDLADLLGVTLDRLTWAIGETAEEELVTLAITSLRERMQEAAVAIIRLRVAQGMAEGRAAAAADSDYPHVRELGSDLEEDLRSVDLDAVFGLASILWRRYKQPEVGWDPGDDAPFRDDLDPNTRLSETLQHISEKYGIDPGDNDFTRREDP